MKTFRWIMIAFLSMFFIVGVGSQAWSACPPLSITSSSTLPAGTVGQAYTNQLQTSGGQTPITYSLVSGSLPPGLNLSSTGLISGTPTSVGSYNFTVKATDSCPPGPGGGQQTAQKGFNLTINPAQQQCPALNITSPSTLPSGTKGFAYSKQLQTSGGQPPITFSKVSGSLPSGLNLSQLGLLSGTPTATGTYNFTVKATDICPSGAQTAQKTFSLTILHSIKFEPLPMSPDLQVGVIKISPQTPGEGQVVTFEGNVMNYGLGLAKDPVVILTVAGPAGVNIPLFRKEFNVTLEKNQGVTLVKKFRVPKHGNYTATLTLDPADMIAETNNNNNKKDWTFGVHPLADLIVCISNGKRPPVGGKRNIHAVVKNIGNYHSIALAGIKLNFYVKGKGTKIYDIPPLSPGDSHRVTRNHKWWTAGTKTIKAKIFYPENEINRNNNEVSGSYFVRLPHHDKYSTAPHVKCSTNKDFNSWEQCDNLY